MVARVDARDLRRARAAERAALAEQRRAAGRDAPWRRRYRMARRRIGGILLDALLPTALKLLARTWKLQRVGVEHFDSLMEGGAFVAAMWHGEMLAPAPVHRHRGIAVLVSPSDDGGLVVKVLGRYGYRIVRGSTSKRGARAMREMRDALESGTPVVVTPDGPRGPIHSINVGVAWLAREVGCPILPVTTTAESAWHLRSWDRFAIPKPFTRVRMIYHAPVRVPPEASDDQLERIAEAMRTTMLADDAPTADASPTAGPDR